MTLLITYAMLALGVSFFCSISEATVLSVTPSYVVALEEKGRWTGRLLGRLKRDIDRSLAAILSLNTIANTVGAVGVGAQASSLFSEQLGEAAVGVSSGVLTFLILVLSEIIPKTIGAVYWRRIAPAVGVLVRGIMIVLYPLVVLSECITKLLSRQGAVGLFNQEEFRAMADLGAREGQLAVKESRVLKNLFRFGPLRARDIMPPRTVALLWEDSRTVGEVLEAFPDLTFSRIPVYSGTPDDFRGFVLKTDLLLAQAEGKNDIPLTQFTRCIEAIPENVSLNGLLEFLLDKRAHILLVLDEYGGLEGVVSLEDLVETLLGLEIVDEADKTVDLQALARARRHRQAERSQVQLEPNKRDGHPSKDQERNRDAYNSRYKYNAE